MSCTFDTNLKLRGASSQYSGFNFNSMVKFGNTYLGANSDGLHELSGDDDNGVKIAASFKFVKSDLGILNPKHVRSMFIGYKSDGRLLIVPTADDVVGESRSIPSTNNKQSYYKIPYIHTLQGRYWSFEISNVSGSYFTIDSLDALIIVRNSGIKSS